MNLHGMLTSRAQTGNPIRIGLVGVGKFGTMFLSQARTMVGVHILGIADLAVERMAERCLGIGWAKERLDATNCQDAVDNGTTWLMENAEEMIRNGCIDVLIEATGSPAAGIHHCLMAIEQGIHVIMANVEADVVAGPLLARKAQSAGMVYSLAWGDQPALICEHIDWARTCGFDVVCAGKGTRHHPTFCQSTPQTVWNLYGLDPQDAERGGMNPKMFNSFVDGSKSAIEMTAVCNASGLTPQEDGLGFPPASCRELAQVCKPHFDGGVLSHVGTTEVVSSLNYDMSPVEDDLRFGTFVVVTSDNNYVRRCFGEYGMQVDETGRYCALFRPSHMIGLELGISVASVALRGEPTGAPFSWSADTIAVAKRDLKAKEILDGEGGCCVWGKQVPADQSHKNGLVPLGLTHDVMLLHDIPRGKQLCWDDIEYDESCEIMKIRREMEAEFGSDVGGLAVTSTC